MNLKKLIEETERVSSIGNLHYDMLQVPPKIG